MIGNSFLSRDYSNEYDCYLCLTMMLKTKQGLLLVIDFERWEKVDVIILIGQETAKQVLLYDQN